MENELIKANDAENEVMIMDEDFEKPKWGLAHPRRGMNHFDEAKAFIKDFPIGSKLSAEEFDEWAQHKGYLNAPIGAKKSSDAWLAHLQRRHQLRYNINKAATHPRMTDAETGISPFYVDSVTQGMWIVRSVQGAIAKNSLPKKIQTLFVTKRKQLDYLMQSADWSILPVHEQIIAEELYEDIDRFEERMDFEADTLSQKYLRLEYKIKKSLEKGEIKPINHGIAGLISQEAIQHLEK